MWGATSTLFFDFGTLTFQSTLPVWGATGRQEGAAHPLRCISIHAPRVGSDAVFSFQGTRPARISIHAPRVGSDTGCSLAVLSLFFISIHAPRVGSDAALAICAGWASPISIHAPRVGSDASIATGIHTSPDFNPRSPCGERLEKQLNGFLKMHISIHAPRVGSDFW